MSMSSLSKSLPNAEDIFDDESSDESDSSSDTKVAGSEDASKNTKAAAPPVNKVAGSADSSRNTKSTVKAPGGKDASRQKDGG